MDNRPRAHYARDARGSEGVIVGPNGFGEYMVVDEVQWDGARSTAFFRNATTDELPTPAPASLTPAQTYRQFWSAAAARERFQAQRTVATEAQRKEAKRLARAARGDLSKRQFARVQKSP